MARLEEGYAEVDKGQNSIVSSQEFYRVSRSEKFRKYIPFSEVCGINKIMHQIDLDGFKSRHTSVLIRKRTYSSRKL